MATEYERSRRIFHEKGIERFQGSNRPFDRYVQSPLLTGVVNSELKISVSTPRFEQAKKYGHLPVNPFTYERSDRASGRFTAPFTRVFTGTDGTYIDRDFTGVTNTWGIAVPCPDPWTRITELNPRILDKIKGTAWQTPVVALEARKTAEMVAKTAVTLASSYRSLRKGDFSGAAAALGIVNPRSRSRARYERDFGKSPKNAAANGWLELQYGWTPLIMDIHTGAETVANLIHSPRNAEVTVRVKRSYNLVKDGTTFIETSPYHLEVSYNANTKITQSMGVTFRKDYAPAAAVALGITNPALVAWEVVPLSFVVDWFLPVGDFLSQLDATVGSVFVSGYQAAVAEHICVQQPTSFPYNGLTLSGSDRQTQTRKARVKLHTFPNVVVPPIEPHASIKRMFSGLALLNNAFRK